MHDIRFIREHPADFDAALARRGLPSMSGEILEMDQQRRALQGRIQELQSRRNVASKEIGLRKGKGEDADDLIAEVADIKSSMPALEAEEGALALGLEARLMELPNYSTQRLRRRR